MASIMADDSTISSPGASVVYGLALAAEMAKISQFKIHRYSIATWAQTLNFLVYDDDEDTSACSTESRMRMAEDQRKEMRRRSYEEKQRRYELQAPAEMHFIDKQKITTLQVKEQQEVNAPNASEFAIPGSWPTWADPLEPQSQAYNSKDQDPTSERRYSYSTSEMPKIPSCVECSHFPEFPTREKPKNFAVAYGMQCGDFIAISYCWPKVAMGNPAHYVRTYRVRARDRNGKWIERLNNAPDDVIDRAVEVARSLGIKMIWIDQECLPQHDCQEKETGIQVMDMIYQRAHLTIGLLASVPYHQSHLNAAASVLFWSTNDENELVTEPPNQSPEVIAQDLLLFGAICRGPVEHSCLDPARVVRRMRYYDDPNSIRLSCRARGTI